MNLSLFMHLLLFTAFGRHVSGMSLSYLFNIGLCQQYNGLGQPFNEIDFGDVGILIIISPVVGIKQYTRFK
jgi:hypothetical protein